MYPFAESVVEWPIGLLASVDLGRYARRTYRPPLDKLSEMEAMKLMLMY